MRRMLIVLLLVPAIMAVTGGQAAMAAPANSKNSDRITIRCGETAVTVLLGPGHGIKIWGMDPSGELDGRGFILRSTGFRAYEGDLATEPADQDPVFSFSRTFGKRVGQINTLSCTNRDTFTYEGQVHTAFFALELTVVTS